MLKRTKNQKRRGVRVRSKAVGSKLRPRLTVYRSTKYIYAQIIDDSSGITLCSTCDRLLDSKELKGKTKTEKAFLAGKEIAKKGKKRKISKVVFDRGGYKYHGRVKALADGAREGGLKF